MTPSQAPALGSFWLNSGPLCVPPVLREPTILAERETGMAGISRDLSAPHLVWLDLKSGHFAGFL